jgi:ABC-type transport system involved in multi-copper enzyme maturation permease subunit
MVLEQELLPYFQWLLTGDTGSLGALIRFLLVGAGLGLFSISIGYLLSAARHGILRGGDVVYSTLAGGLSELWQTSARRVWALARLAIKEALRRRVLAALVVFLVVLLFANWFLSTDHQQPARLFVSFVLTASTYLVLGVAILLSAFSLPSDFKTKTVYTVVTKPVRASEVILGRILGFGLIGTLLLVVMGIASYVFVIRSLNHSHLVETSSLVRVDDSQGNLVGRDGRTTNSGDHRHDVEIDEQGNGTAQPMHGHTHDISQRGDQLVVSPPLGFLRARVPQYGKIRFIDRQGAEKDSGISVGSEWAYRSFIDGNTQAAAIWKFSNVDDSLAIEDAQGREFLPLGLIVRVFRSHKGVIGQAITGSIQLRNPITKVASSPIPFAARDAQIDLRDIPRELVDDKDQRPIDLFDDLVSEQEELEVVIQCLERGQYFGFAQADCYLRLPEGSSQINLAKVYLSIWVQMIIVTSVGVAISTLVSGPVALLFTASFILLGFFRQDFLDIATGNVYGGGPAESMLRIANQSNVMVQLEPTLGAQLVQGFDQYFARPVMWGVAQLLPDFAAFSTVSYAADGYLVPWNRVFQDVTVCAGYIVGLAILGFFLLRTREVAK